MTLESQILRDLTAGQSTADAIAERLRKQTRAVEIVLQRMVSEETVRQATIMGGALKVFRIDVRDHRWTPESEQSTRKEINE